MIKTALLFPGQGSQYIGMGKSLCENYSVAKETFEEAGDILKIDIMKLCFEGDMTELTKTENTQPAILTASAAAFRVYMKETGLQPFLTAGHSLGEFTALTCAGAVEFKDCLQIVRQRGRFMQEAVSDGNGMMLAVNGLRRSEIEKCCNELSEKGHRVFISNYNSPLQTVISGLKEAVQKAGSELEKLNAVVIPLKVSAPFHSMLMLPAAEKLENEMKKYRYSPLKWPVISNVSALPYKSHTDIIPFLKDQMVSPVRWQESMEYMEKQGITIAIEAGPKSVLKKLTESSTPGIKAFSYDLQEDVKAFIQEVNADNNGEFKHTVVTKCIAVAVCTRNRNWNNEEYRKGVIEPYREIQALQADIEKEGRTPTAEEMKKALQMLQSVFITKKVPIEEQIERFNEVLEINGSKEIFSELHLPGKVGEAIGN